MSFYKAKDELTYSLIKIILTTIGESGRATTAELGETANSQLSSKHMRRLKLKGEKAEIKRLIHYLKSRGYISHVFGRGERATYHLSTTGWRRLEELNFKPLAQQVDKWDGRWRLLVFDIPEQQRSARDAIRRLIKQLGFVQLQRSVWIQPLPCEAEVQAIKNAYNLDEQALTVFVVESFDGEKAYYDRFASQLDGLKR